MADYSDVYDIVQKMLDTTSQQADMLSQYSKQTASSVDNIANKLDDVNRVATSGSIPPEARAALKSAIVDIIDICKNIMENDHSFKIKIHDSNSEMLEELIQFLRDSSQKVSDGDNREQDDE